MNCEMEWLAEARRQYKTPEDISVRAETNFGRANQVTELLERKVLPVTSRPSILLVGVGCLGDRFVNPIRCTYTPFVSAAWLDARNVQYRMVVVDIIDNIVEDVRKREHLYLTHYYFQDYLDTEDDWKKYLVDTGQQDRVINSQEDGLVFMDHTELSLESYLQSGIHAAGIPRQFRSKVQSGEIALVNDDIAEVDLSCYPKFNLVECANVLYHLPTVGQMLALANITSATNKDGIILVNDFGDYNGGTPLFSETGGWLTKERLEQLGLVIDESKETQEEIPDGRYTDIVTIIRALLRKK